MKKYIKMLIFIVVMLCVFIVPTTSNTHKIISSKNSDETAKIYLEAEVTDNNGVGVSNDSDSGKVGFYIKSTVSVNNVAVSWRTKDMSAVASTGDYTAKESTYYLTGTTSSLIYITIGNSGAGTIVSRQVQQDTSSSYHYTDLTSENSEVTRSFYVEITGITNNSSSSVSIDTSKSKILLSSGYNISYDVDNFVYSTGNKRTSYFRDYYGIESYNAKGYGDNLYTAVYQSAIKDVRKNKTKSTSSGKATTQEIITKYLDTGLADLYANISATAYEDGSSGSKKHVYMGIKYDDSNGGYVTRYELDYQYTYSKTKYKALTLQKRARTVTSPGKVITGHIETGGYWGNWNSSTWYGATWVNEWWQVKDYNKNIKAEFTDFQDCGTSRDFYDIYIRTGIADTTAPTVSGYYLSDKSIKQGEKLGLSVRFSEPVQLKDTSTTPSILGYINASSNTKYPVTFKYVSGAGTDTLYFEWDPSEDTYSKYNVKITKFVLNTFNNFDNICDYSYTMTTTSQPWIYTSEDTSRDDHDFNGMGTLNYYFCTSPSYSTFINHNAVSVPTNTVTLNYSLNLKTPTIDTSARVSSRAIKSVEVAIDTRELDSDATLYYTWSKQSEDPGSYDYSVSNVGDIYTIRATDLNGEYYLYVKAVSSYGKESSLSLGAYKFDNTAPTVNLTAEGSLTSKTFKISVDDLPDATYCSNGISKVVLVIASDANFENVIKSYTYSSIGDTSWTKEVVVTASDLGLGSDESKTYYVYAYALDDLDNEGVSEISTYKYDTRTYFEVEFDSAKNGEDSVLLYDGITTDYKIVNVSSSATIKYLSTIAESQSVAAIIKDKDGTTINIDTSGNIVVKSSAGVTLEAGSYDSLIDSLSLSNDTSSLTLVIPEGFSSGYYEITLTLTENGTTKYSENYNFYFTNDEKDSDIAYYSKITSGLLLTNDVYQLSSSLLYYYMDANGNILSENYGGTSKAATFSSSYEAIKYLAYMEYQDLYPIILTSTQATALNNGGSINYIKASGETTVASAGQIWIRYKASTYNNNPTTTSWVYYYYNGSSTTLRKDTLSSTLLNAIDTISERLAKNYGESLRLVSEDNLNKYNEPYLDSAQMHVAYESAATTKCNTPFYQAIDYSGDSKLYQSTITENGESYYLATNLEISKTSYNHLLYKLHDGDTYKEIDLASYSKLSDVITGSGIYDLVEITENGVRTYSVYIDNSAPSLEVYINNRLVTYTSEAGGNTYTAKKFSINAITSEIDPYAYVSIWRYVSNKTGSLLYVYLVSDLEDTTYALEDGNYHIEVYDRSGNGFSFVIRIKSEELTSSYSITENEYITLSCNREESDIQSYEVYLNQELISSTYSSKQRFYDSGTYRFKITDIYGESYDSGEVVFKRTSPTLTWKYYDPDSKEYVTYDEQTSTRMKITKVNSTTYKVLTSALVQFKYDSLYTYKITNSDVKYSESTINKTVTLTNLESFSVKVSYASYSETSITYICEVDSTAPNINVSYDKANYMFSEDNEFKEQISSGGSDGDTLTYDTISYYKSSSSTVYVTDGESIVSKLIKLSLSDNNGVSLVYVYLDDNKLYELTSGFDNIILSRYGVYTIEAYDSLLNKATFTFTNNLEYDITYKVDDTTYDSTISTIDYFDKLGNFSKIEYGNNLVTLLFKDDASISFKITKDGNAICSTYEIIDGVVYYVHYIISGTEYESVYSDSLFDISNKKITVNTWYLLDSSSTLSGLNIYAMYDSNGYITLKLENSSSTSTIEGRVDAGNNEPFYFKAMLSRELSDVVVVDSNGNTIETNQDETQIKINSDFSVSNESLDYIKNVKVYYSLTSTFNTYETIYDKESNVFNSVVFKDEGLYLIEITNVYGNITKYYLIRSESFTVTTEVELSDGKTFNYSTSYDDTIYSNYAVYLNAYSTSVKYSITKDGLAYTNIGVSIGNAITVFSFKEEGSYVINLTDEFGNVFTNNIVIKSNNLTYDDNLIYGFNDRALRKDEGYTNYKLSISKDTLDKHEISYISITYNNKEYILLDLISESKVSITDSDLTSCIGTYGDGVYIITFKDKYGNNMQPKTINYSDTSTLSLQRTLRSSTSILTYDLEDALNDGFWANNSLIFTSSASTYKFSIDGSNVDCPRTLNFESGADEGEFVYQVYYLDEYGFEYEFEAHLFRTKLTLTLPSDITTITYDGVLVTRNNIYVTTPDSATTTYLLNGVEKEYTSNTVLKSDGTYRFTSTDKAGNVNSLTIKKDTAVEFEMFETSTNQKVINGGIVCSQSVTFKVLNEDSTYLKAVYKDGSLISNYDDNKFTSNGKWEILLADNIGNETYFSFRIITNKLSNFEYTTPYGYKISEIWYNSGDDNLISYMQYVTESGTKITLSENGKYSAVMTSSTSGITSNFSITINNAAPEISLVGCSDGETTINAVTVKGYSVGDTIYVYRDGVLVSTTEILTQSTDAPTISEGGTYEIVVTNEAGVSTKVSFTKKAVPNGAGNVLIIVGIVAVALVVFIGLVYRQRSKVDE